jgi:hypothetical protein
MFDISLETDTCACSEEGPVAAITSSRNNQRQLRVLNLTLAYATDEDIRAGRTDYWSDSLRGS